MSSEDYALYTTADLVNELRKYSNAYTLIYLKHDEDTGPNSIKTNVNCYETAKMQIFGLVAKLHWWMRFRITAPPKPPGEPEPEPPTNLVGVVLNKDGKDILDILKKRCNAGVFGVVFKEEHEVYMMNWESTKGQSMGLMVELHEKIMSQ
jgi:hypothetical protein